MLDPDPDLGFCTFGHQLGSREITRRRCSSFIEELLAEGWQKLAPFVVVPESKGAAAQHYNI